MHSQRRNLQRQRLSVSKGCMRVEVCWLLRVRLTWTYDAADLQFTAFNSALPRFITVGEFV